ncbi:hypothetical protein PMAYCL1PPCAC_07522, partial [Pristionchus mayeri]
LHLSSNSMILTSILFFPYFLSASHTLFMTSNLRSHLQFTPILCSLELVLCQGTFDCSHRDILMSDKNCRHDDSTYVRDCVKCPESQEVRMGDASVTNPVSFRITSFISTLQGLYFFSALFAFTLIALCLCCCVVGCSHFMDCLGDTPEERRPPPRKNNVRHELIP